MTSRIVGREVELGALREFAAAGCAGPGVMVLEGSAGIGKSTLWLAGVEAARERGFRVLCSRPAEAERGLPHAGLADLLEPVLEELLPALPPPRRHALEVALLLAEAEEHADPRTLPVAVRSALGALAEQRPLLLAVDDVQWLDPSSSAALAFAVRRLEDEPVRLLLARRVEEGADPAELERALPAERTERVPVSPLSLGATQRLLQERLGRLWPRPVLVRLHEASGGNPFYALELARALPEEVDPTRPLPVPVTLEGLVRARLAGLPEETREALAVAAALGRADIGLLERAGVHEDALEPAERAHVIARDNGHVRFTHPLLASVLERQQPATERRSMHARLARLVEDPVARARHLALAAEPPSAEVSAALAEAAAVASARGAVLAAIELAEHALRLTPPEDDADVHRRTTTVARAYLAAGDLERARSHAGRLVERAPPGERRAEALVLLAEVEGGARDTRRWLALLRAAVAEAGDARIVRARAHTRLASWTMLQAEPVSFVEPHVRAALELARSEGDEAMLAEALGAYAAVRHRSGHADALAIADDARRCARSSGDPDAVLYAEMNRTRLLIETGHFGEARATLEALEQEWTKRSDLVNLWIFSARSILELAAGEFASGSGYAARAHELAALYGRDGPSWIWYRAAYAAIRGDLEEARALAEEGCHDRVLLRAHSEAVLGSIEFWSGNPGSAAERFAAAEQARREAGEREPHLFWWRADYAEALLGVGRTGEAKALVDDWEREARRLGRELVLAQVLRCRGLIAGADGRVEEATALLEEAADRLQRLGDRYGQARALLSLGAMRRRARQKRAARVALEDAVAVFDECGAKRWASRARGELGSIGGRRREEGLTAAERRVAELVSEGKTNREAAAVLFLSERTVASHLSHVYTKLGVRSRTELARSLAG